MDSAGRSTTQDRPARYKINGRAVILLARRLVGSWELPTGIRAKLRRRPGHLAHRRVRAAAHTAEV